MKAHYNPTEKLDGIITDFMLMGGHMLNGGKQQLIHETSTIQNYDIGTRLVMDDRTFRYCKAGGNLKSGYGARCQDYPREGNMAAVALYAGGFEVTIPMNDNGVDYAAEQLADYWKDGYIWIMTADARGFGPMYRIKSNLAATGTIPTRYCTATLYEALAYDVAASAWITAHPNMYNNIKSAAYQKSSVVCVPLVYVASGYYFWGQTWGPCTMQQTHAAGGLENDDRMFFFHENNNGEIVTGSQVADIKLSQFAGFLLTHTTAWVNVGDGAEAGGDCFLMLQLSP